MKNKILFVFVVLLLGILISGCGSENKKIKYAKENKLAKLFLEYNPDAQYEFNSEKTRLTYYKFENNRKLYIQVPAQDEIKADETLYCMEVNDNSNKAIFAEDKDYLIENKLKDNSCFK